MQERLGHIVFDEGLIKKTDRIVCAVSGGADSIVMAHLLKKLGLKILIAHCNFNLRGKESDEDAEFVRFFCDKHSLPFISKSFDTSTISLSKKTSIQETARNLRYNWFEEIRIQHNYDFIATAHNLSDNAETLIINQLRGTGLDGLKGIPSTRNAIIRPMLAFSAREIRTFANQHNIKFRNDSSNQSDKYLRNAIRLNVSPHLHSIEPAFEHVFKENAFKLSESAELLDAFISDFKNNHVTNENGCMYVPINALRSYPHPHIILSKLLPTAQFDFSQLRQILDTKTIGKFIESESHTVHYDRENLVVRSKEKTEIQPITLDQVGTFQYGGYKIKVSKVEVHEVSLPLSKNEIILNVDLDRDALQIRSWQHTDRIQPFGMEGRKLVSDVFIDSKIPQPLKSSTPILTVNNQISWVAGLCFSETFKVDFNTLKPDQKLIRISLLER